MAATDSEDRLAKLRDYVSALSTETAYLEECLEQATTFVEEFVGERQIADAKLERAILEVGAALYERKQSRSGGTGFDGVDVTSLSVPKDPMRMAYPILSPDLPGLA